MFKEIKKLIGSQKILKGAYEETFDMLKEALFMYRETERSLRKSETGEVGFNVYEKDRRINQFQLEVRKKLITHIVVGGFSSSVNAGAGLALTSIVIDVERIADYTKNIWELAVAHPSKLICGSLEKDVADLEAAVETKFERVIDALEHSDEDKATIILHDYEEIPSTCNSIIHKLISEEVSDLNQGAAVATALYTRFLKRINGHLTNLTMSIVDPYHRIGFKLQEEDSKS